MTYEFTNQYQREANDFYIEPRWAVESLIAAHPFEGVIHDPACGSGNIPKTFIANGFVATGADIKDRSYPSTRLNYLTDNYPHENIVTNPPYKLSEAFIRHALLHTTRDIAILARIAFLNGQARFKLFKSNPPSRVVILSRRPSMPPGGQFILPQGGKTDFCWIIWSNHLQSEQSVICWTL